MKHIYLLLVLLGGCNGCAHQQPTKQMSSKDCVTWVCPQDSGKGECKCAD